MSSVNSRVNWQGCERQRLTSRKHRPCPLRLVLLWARRRSGWQRACVTWSDRPILTGIWPRWPSNRPLERMASVLLKVRWTPLADVIDPDSLSRLQRALLQLLISVQQQMASAYPPKNPEEVLATGLRHVTTTSRALTEAVIQLLESARSWASADARRTSLPKRLIGWGSSTVFPDKRRAQPKYAVAPRCMGARPVGHPALPLAAVAFGYRSPEGS